MDLRKASSRTFSRKLWHNLAVVCALNEFLKERGFQLSNNTDVTRHRMRRGSGKATRKLDFLSSTFAISGTSGSNSARGFTA